MIGCALAQKLTEQWGEPVTMENISGAGATAGPAQVAKSPADGYTLLVTTSALAYSAALSKSLPYDPPNAFIPVAPLTSQPYVLVAGKLGWHHYRQRTDCGGEGEARSSEVWLHWHGHRLTFGD